jgi:hypothetical protein
MNGDGLNDYMYWLGEWIMLARRMKPAGWENKWF